MLDVTNRLCIFLLGACALLAGCASTTPPPEAVSTTQLTSSDVAAPSEGAPTTTTESGASAVPKTFRTPRRQLKAKTPEDLERALPRVHKTSSVDGAARRLTESLGKPSWSETVMGMTELRRVWIAPIGARCQRLVLEPDGSARLDAARFNDWRPITSTAKQNPCTGEIRRIKLRNK